MGGIAAKRASASLRARVWLRSGSLDRELATGCSPTREETIERARQLSELNTRRRLARSIRRVVDGAVVPAAIGQPGPIDRLAVQQLREALLGTAERLERPGPLNPCGVARVSVLLGDGSGPIYGPSADQSLADAIWWVADGLQPCPPHAWDCPVIMKLDPEHVAWTCKRCGAIGISDDLTVRPG